LQGLLKIVGIEMMAEGVRAGTHLEGWRERIPDCTAATLKLWAPNEMRTCWMESKLVFDNLREQVE